MGFKKVVKKIFDTIWKIIKGIALLIKDYMTSTWDKWDEEFAELDKNKK